MSKIKNDGLGQYGAEPFEHQQFRTAGVEWVKSVHRHPGLTYISISDIRALWRSQRSALRASVRISEIKSVI